MRTILVLFFFLSLSISPGVTEVSEGPQPAAPAASIMAPEDKPYPGVITLAVDATDIARRTYRVHETIPVQGGKDLVLLYPKWLPGRHAPLGRMSRIAGLVITSNGTRIEWVRDSVDMYAIHVAAPAGATSLDLDFQYLSPVNDDVGDAEVSGAVLLLEWSSVVFYPAGFFTRQITVDASVKLPENWELATALERPPANGTLFPFKRVALETLVDSPVVAGRHSKRLDLDPNATIPVHLNVFAERPELLAFKPAHLDAHRSLIRQAYKLFGGRHYDHFDFLLTLSDNFKPGGLEHHQSTQINSHATYFTEWDNGSSSRDLAAHELTHSWNGKFRRPADLWTANYHVPMRNSLLWVYEGLTEYWGKVLAARSGLWSREESLDDWARVTAYYTLTAGRQWRSLADTTNDGIIAGRAPLSWPSWQRSEDYYEEGALLWLDADTVIRERSNGQRSLDDFARSFFGINDGSLVPVTYTFDDVVKALNDVQSYDWATFLRGRISSVTPKPPLDGITRSGYRLVFTDNPGTYFKSRESRAKISNHLYSIGLAAAKDGTVKNVLWDGPAFKAGLAAGVQILAVNGTAFDEDRLKESIKATQDGSKIELIVKDRDLFRVVGIEYQNGLRYPHLQRDAPGRGYFDEINAARE